ncbi:branched-chain amino acid ABC transporter substrate-binding protein [Synergistales bacterium]|nr:branched-chain amino acid ABC transporter substrate-binding protein [Synergistales bacterium]
MKKSYITRALVIVIAISMLFISVSKGNAADAGKFILGFCTPLSGPNAEAGMQHLNSIKLAVKQINEKGGLNGQQVEIIAYDDEANPATSLAAMTKLATTDKANAVIGSIMSGCMIGALETIEQYKLPTFTGGMSSSLTEKGCHYIFRSVINQDYVLGDVLNSLQLTGVKKVGIFTNQDEAQINAGDRFAEECKKLGIEVVGREFGTDADTDYTAQCARLIDVEPDAMYFALVTPIQPLFVRQVRDLGFRGMLWNRESFQQNGIDVAGNSASNYVAFSWPCVSYTDANDATGTMKDYLTAYKAEYGQLPTSDTAYRGYDAMLVLEEACKIAGSNKREDIAAAVNTIKGLKVLGGEMDYTNGIGEGYQKGQVYYIKDGKYHSFQEWYDKGGYDEFIKSIS